MKHVWWRTHLLYLAVLLCWLPASVWAGPPPQMLPSAMLVYPLIQVGSGDTRIELLNLSGDPQLVNCFYVDGDSCNEIGFLVSLTAYQPISWFASAGFNNTQNGSAVPPFFGTGELKCVVVPPHPELQFHNTIQGRATVFGADGRTISYGAVGFQRLTDGDFTGTVSLDGSTYAQCPAVLHFDVLADQTGAGGGSDCDSSDPRSCLVLLTCSEDLLLQMPSRTTVQFLVTNEFEQPFSSSTSVTCFAEKALSDFTDSLSRATLGSDTAHLSVRGVSVPLLGLVRDSVPFGSSFGTAGNEPSFQGGRSATVIFP